MHKSWRFIPSLKVLVVTLGVSALLALGISSALAQSSASDAPGAPKKYVLMATSTWGAAQNTAITRVGGTVDYSHAASGIGFATSADPDFMRWMMKTGVFARGAEDIMVQWQDPSERIAEETVEEEAVTPGDETFVNEQWNIVAMECAGAWATGLTGAGVRVAVIDGGLYNSHIDLTGNVDVARSVSFVPGFAFNQDVGTFWHATHVAGIVAAKDNAIGTVGVAPGATIIGIKALHAGSGTFEAVIAGILYAADAISDGGAGADIINMSLGATFAKGGGNNGLGALVAAMNKAVNYATDHNVLVVCSAGNNGIDMDHAGSITSVPASSGTALAVSATGPLGYGDGWPSGATNFRHPAYYTNYGNSHVSLAAPGGEDSYPVFTNCAIPRCCGGPAVNVPCWVHDLVMSTVRGSGASITTYGWADGTSMAAPAVSGVAALVKERFPGISVDQLKTHLFQTADGVGGSDPLRPYYGHGLVNARRAATEGGPVSQAAGNPAPKVEPMAAVSRVELVIARNGSSLPEISFSLPSPAQARVELFDVAGRKVAVLYDGQASAGRTTLSWSSGAPRPGAYFARLTAGGVQSARQIVLLGQ